MRRSARLAGLALAAVLVCAAAIFGVLHTPPGRALVRSAVVSWLLGQGIDVSIGSLRYNLTTLSFDLEAVQIRAKGSQIPFLTADRIQADAPWSLVRGNIQIDAIALTRPVIRIVREPDGTLNLPQGSDGGGPPLARFAIAQLELEQATARYDDDQARQHIELSTLTLRLLPADGGARGRIEPGSRLSVQWADLSADGPLTGTLDGGLAYDGVGFALNDFTLTSELGKVQLDGRADIFGASPKVALGVGATLALEPISKTFAIDPVAAGTVTLTGRVEGPRDKPAATVDARSDEIRYQHLIAHTVTVRAAATSDQVTLESASIGLGAGVVDAKGTYAFRSGQARASATWRGVPIDAIASMEPSAIGRTRLSGQADLDALLSDAARTLGVEATVRADTAGARTLDGRLSLSTQGDAWRAQTTLTSPGKTRVNGRFAGQLAHNSLTDSSVRGSLTLDAEELPGVTATAGRLDLWKQTWPAVESGALHATFDVGGTLASPTAKGDVALADVRAAGFGPLAARTTLAVEPSQFAVRALEGTIGGNRLTGDITVARTRETLAGHLELAVADFHTLGDDVVNRWHPAGQLNAQIDLAGTASEPAATISAQGTGLAVAGQDLGTLSAAATASTDAVVISNAELKQSDGGRMLASGRYAIEGDAHSLKVQVEQLLLSPVWVGNDNRLPLAGQINGALDLGGTPDRPTGGGRLAMADFQWTDAYLELVTADLALADGNATVDLNVPVVALHAKAITTVAEPHDTTLTVDATDTDVATAVVRAGSFAPPLLTELSGKLKAHMTAQGTPAAVKDATATARIDTLDLMLRGAALQLDEPAAAEYRAGDLSVQSFRVRTGNARLALTGRIVNNSADGLRAQLDGSLQDFRPWMVAFGAPDAFEAAGTVALTAEATGSLDRPVLTADAKLADGRLTWPNTPAVRNVATTITLRNGVVDVPSVEAEWQGGNLNGQARMPLRFLNKWVPARLLPDDTAQTATARVKLDRLTPALAAPWVDAATLDDLSGRATVDLEFTAEQPVLEAVTGTLRIPLLNLTAHGVPIEQTRETRVDLANGLLRVADWEWTVAGSPLVVTGTAGVVPDAAVDMRVNGRLDLAILGLFLPNGATDGSGDLALALRGTTSAPVAEGTLKLADGEIQLSDPRIGLSSLNGSLVFKPGRIDVQDVTGALNGGDLKVTGGLDYKGTTFTGGSVVMTAQNVALDVPEGVRTEVNADVTLGANDDGMRLAGRVDILRGGYREPLSLAAALALAGRDTVVALTPEDTGPSMLEEIDLNIAVASSEDLVVDNNYGRLALGLDVRLVGTLAEPSVVGRAEIREGGALFLGGRTYLVDRGIIDFSDPRQIVPNLDVTGRTRVNGTDESGAPATYDITLEITGTPETLKTNLTSSPDRSQADIVSLLATGRLADQVGGAGTAIARDQFIGYLSGETLGFAARAIGVDAIRLERGATAEDLTSDASLAGEVNPAQRLTVSRRISNKAEITVSQNLRETNRQTWIASLTPGKSIELRTLSRDDTSRSYEVRHDVAFGGPPPPPPPPKRAAGNPIVGVRVTGETALPVSEVEGALKLKAGKRFDFLKWQEDRDRLRKLYVDRGYREVRISARQVPTTAKDGTPAGVTLEYHITANAPTVIEIEGVNLPPDVRGSVERIWNEATLDVGLVGDVDAAVRAYLASEGFLRARVRVRRIAATTNDPRTRLRVRVSPGPRSVARTIDVKGNAVIPTKEITELADQLGASAWLTPDKLAGDIKERYRQQGYLATTVKAGPIVFQGERASLPINIQEGLPFTVGTITINGATSRKVPAALRDLGVAEGEAFTPDRLPKGRQALVAAYAEDGFNQTEVAIGTAVDAEKSLVHLNVNVDEGVQQVVADLSVTGAEGVAPKVVNRAMQVTPGMPADMEKLYTGRRRLFQTGLFRRADVQVEPIPDIETPAGVEPVRANVTLIRSNPWRVRYGVSITDELAPIVEQGRTFGGGANVALERQGLFGRPGSSTVSFRYNNDQQVARGSVTWPTLFGRAISSRFYTSRSRQSVNGEDILSFITDKTTFTAEQRITIGTRTQIAYAYQLERNHVFAPNADPDDPFSLNERWRQGRLSTSFVFDNRSDLTEPTKGLLHSSTVELGLESLGRNGRFMKYSLQELHFVPVKTRLVSASAVRLNVGRGFGGQALILSERFLAGGANTVRGYPDDGLAGFDFFGDPIAGQATLVLNQEARVMLSKYFRGVGFVDAGQVFESARDLSLASLQWAAGIGVRVKTPVGLFRFDVAAPLPRRDLPLRYNFGFGHVF